MPNARPPAIVGHRTDAPGSKPFPGIAEVSVINPHHIQKDWQATRREPAVQLYLSSVDSAAPDVVGGRAGGFPTELSVVPVSDWIFPDALEGNTAAIIQV